MVSCPACFIRFSVLNPPTCICLLGNGERFLSEVLLQRLRLISHPLDVCSPSGAPSSGAAFPRRLRLCAGDRPSRWPRLKNRGKQGILLVLFIAPSLAPFFSSLPGFFMVGLGCVFPLSSSSLLMFVLPFPFRSVSFLGMRNFQRGENLTRGTPARVMDPYPPLLGFISFRSFGFFGPFFSFPRCQGELSTETAS